MWGITDTAHRWWLRMCYNKPNNTVSYSIRSSPICPRYLTTTAWPRIPPCYLLITISWSISPIMCIKPTSSRIQYTTALSIPHLKPAIACIDTTAARKPTNTDYWSSCWRSLLSLASWRATAWREICCWVERISSRRLTSNHFLINSRSSRLLRDIGQSESITKNQQPPSST